MKKVKLLPCWLCGSTDITIFHNIKERGTVMEYLVHCRNRCFATVAETKQEAIKYWNDWNKMSLRESKILSNRATPDRDQPLTP